MGQPVPMFDAITEGFKTDLKLKKYGDNTLTDGAARL